MFTKKKKTVNVVAYSFPYENYFFKQEFNVNYDTQCPFNKSIVKITNWTQLLCINCAHTHGFIDTYNELVFVSPPWFLPVASLSFLAIIKFIIFVLISALEQESQPAFLDQYPLFYCTYILFVPLTKDLISYSNFFGMIVNCRKTCLINLYFVEKCEKKWLDGIRFEKN